MGILWDLSSDKPRYLLKMAIEIVDLPINSMVISHSFSYVYQRVTSHCYHHVYPNKNPIASQSMDIPTIFSLISIH